MKNEDFTMEQPAPGQVEVADAKNKEASVDAFMIEESATSAQAVGSIGKFKSTESLLNAYNSLQAEFTRKCQRLSELENAAQKTVDSADEFIKENPAMVNKILQHYVQQIKNNPSPVSISDTAGSGIPLVAPPQPTTLEEAKEVVKNLFK